MGWDISGGIDVPIVLKRSPAGAGGDRKQRRTEALGRTRLVLVPHGDQLSLLRRFRAEAARTNSSFARLVL